MKCSHGKAKGVKLASDGEKEARLLQVCNKNFKDLDSLESITAGVPVSWYWQYWQSSPFNPPLSTFHCFSIEAVAPHSSTPWS